MDRVHASKTTIYASIISWFLDFISIDQVKAPALPYIDVIFILNKGDREYTGSLYMLSNYSFGQFVKTLGVGNPMYTLLKLHCRGSAQEAIGWYKDKDKDSTTLINSYAKDVTCLRIVDGLQ